MRAAHTPGLQARLWFQLSGNTDSRRDRWETVINTLFTREQTLLKGCEDWLARAPYVGRYCR